MQVWKHWGLEYDASQGLHVKWGFGWRGRELERRGAIQRDGSERLQV